MTRSSNKPHLLTKIQARRIWLHAQRLDTSVPFGDGPEAMREAVEHLGYVQIDTINVIERNNFTNEKYHLFHPFPQRMLIGTGFGRRSARQVSDLIDLDGVPRTRRFTLGLQRCLRLDALRGKA